MKWQDTYWVTIFVIPIYEKKLISEYTKNYYNSITENKMLDKNEQNIWTYISQNMIWLVNKHLKLYLT